MTDTIITIDDVRKAGHCVRGAKTWFESYNLDFADFIRNGIAASRLLATGDAFADQVVNLRLERDDG